MASTCGLRPNICFATKRTVALLGKDSLAIESGQFKERRRIVTL